MTTLLVAHGTRNPHGVKMIGDLAAAIAGGLDETVRVAFIDVLGPAPDEVLRTLHDEPVVLIPALLSSGYHVRSDVPRHVAASGHPAVTVTPAPGPSPELTRAILDRLLEAGWRLNDHVVLAAAGSSDPHAQSGIATAAALLSGLVGSRVSIAFAAPCRDGSGYPSVPEAVARARRAGGRRVAVASYLLADGLFQGRLHEAGADAVPYRSPRRSNRTPSRPSSCHLPAFCRSRNPPARGARIHRRASLFQRPQSGLRLGQHDLSVRWKAL